MRDMVVLPPLPHGARLVWIVEHDGSGIPKGWPLPFALVSQEAYGYKGYRFWADQIFGPFPLFVGFCDWLLFDTLDAATDFYAGYYEKRARDCRENSQKWKLPDTDTEKETEGGDR